MNDCDRLHCNDTIGPCDHCPRQRAITMTPEELRKAEARYQRAFRRSEAMREERNALVLAALREGWTHAAIAEATGLTRGRVGQIAQRG